MAGLSRPSRCGEAQCFADRDHRDKPGDDVGEREGPMKSQAEPGAGHPSRSPTLNTFQDPQPLFCEVAQPPSRWTKECPESTGTSFGTRPLALPNEVGARG